VQCTARVEFFPNVEPDYGIVQIHARGNLSISEKDEFVRRVEERILPMTELKTVYARAGEGQKGSNEVSEDTIGSIQFEFIE
jgi:multidrug efflux pump